MNRSDQLAYRRDARAAHQRFELVEHPSAARGSPKVAVPTCTAAAPARINSTASAVTTPPTPTIGSSGRARCTSYTARTAIGWIAGPDSRHPRTQGRPAVSASITTRAGC